MKRKKLVAEASALMKNKALTEDLVAEIAEQRGGTGFLLGMLSERPGTFNPFLLKGRSIYRPEALDRKTAELVAIGSAAALHCEHCLDAHITRALEEGASLDEIFDALLIAGAISESSTLSVALRKFKQQRERIVKHQEKGKKKEAE